MTGYELDGSNTNDGRGLTYFEVSVVCASVEGVDAGAVPDGDGDCASSADVIGYASDGDDSPPSSVWDCVGCGESLGFAAGMSTINHGSESVSGVSGTFPWCVNAGDCHAYWTSAELGGASGGEVLGYTSASDCVLIGDVSASVSVVSEARWWCGDLSLVSCLVRMCSI